MSLEGMIGCDEGRKGGREEVRTFSREEGSRVNGFRRKESLWCGKEGQVEKVLGMVGRSGKNGFRMDKRRTIIDFRIDGRSSMSEFTIDECNG